MIQGTMSGAGKSLIVAGLCRVFAQDGYRVAPFKSQNMALNSYVTEDGFEMGRAQVVQAYAAYKAPDVRMNPILLKPTSDVGSQVVLMGKSVGNSKAFDYYREKVKYIPIIKDAYDSLAQENDIIVIEGAGSPVEINLRENDIVNMGMAKLADADVYIVGDIDRGGVFAQLLGTMELLTKEERDRVKGLIINKFRGDVSLLESGLDMLTDICHKKVSGVVPYVDVDIEDEDSLAKCLYNDSFIEGKNIDVAVIKLGKISNFTDVAPLSIDKDVSVRYVDEAQKLRNPDLIIIPGSKNTIEDCVWLKESGIGEEIIRCANEGCTVLGICGGYQILGIDILDKNHVETDIMDEISGLGLLPIHTTILDEKTTKLTEGKTGEFSDGYEGLSELELNGYEIHMGKTVYESDAPKYMCPCINDGCVNANVMGTYLHGILENDLFREKLLQIVAFKKGIDREIDFENIPSYMAYRDAQYDRLANVVRDNIDIQSIYDELFNTTDDIIKKDSEIELPYKDLKPADIEKKSFEIIQNELLHKGICLDPVKAPIIIRSIHTTADFDYANNLIFSSEAVEKMRDAIKNGACIVTDTNMAKTGINKTRLSKYGTEVFCFMADENIARLSKETGQTRAAHSMEYAAKMGKDIIFAIGNAPTALIKLDELMKTGVINPKGIIGVPVGFVNVVEAKELIINSSAPYIVARGRKGGSNLAAAICNALLDF